jgi:hypothetical protein
LLGGWLFLSGRDALCVVEFTAAQSSGVAALQGPAHGRAARTVEGARRQGFVYPTADLPFLRRPGGEDDPQSEGARSAKCADSNLAGPCCAFEAKSEHLAPRRAIGTWRRDGENLLSTRLQLALTDARGIDSSVRSRGRNC